MVACTEVLPEPPSTLQSIDVRNLTHYLLLVTLCILLGQ